MRKQKLSEEIFYESLVKLIQSQLINDPNFKSDMHTKSWYERNNKMHYGLFKEKADYILEEIEKMKHLIIYEEERKSRLDIKKENEHPFKVLLRRNKNRKSKFRITVK